MRGDFRHPGACRSGEDKSALTRSPGTTLAIDLDGDQQTVLRTTDQPVRWIKAHRPRKVDLKPLGHL